ILFRKTVVFVQEKFVGTTRPLRIFPSTKSVILCSRVANGQLSATFYATSCPRALAIVKAAVAQAVAKEKRMGASLVRLHFHDCFVNGCDGSILLDDTSTLTGEKTAAPNANSVRGYEVVDTIKTQLEAACSGVVSCADIVAIAARDSVVAVKILLLSLSLCFFKIGVFRALTIMLHCCIALGGPTWTVQLGRRDSTTASLSGANSNLPSPFSDLSTLISAFQAQGLSTKDMIALSGAHTIGQARCITFRTRIYNETTINSTFATSLQANCPSNSGDDNLSPLDVVTQNIFDNNYYKNLRSQKGLLHSDQALFNGGSADAQVTTYSTNSATFFSDFATAMVNMGNISPLTGTNGQ
ncbi:hypothetical protein KI387_023131, partial [Taxus chinensis]